MHEADTAQHGLPLTEDQTKRLIIRRHELEHLLTGKRNAAKQGWMKIIDDIGLHGATPEQCRKKWLNLLRKYKNDQQPREPKRQRREETQKKNDVMERILTNVEKQTELMGKMFDFFMRRADDN
ncbi:uncharacterized protein LOC119388469 [Rhipicephalus sanguineus]|uniref:uncharacterized protein LOC119388469 n=1 Tax=Rhipicephalus sanguineus TaxID=34632 RepID=UPI0020C50ACE|nr:uncharacterized protein LOC119388469 [Rhipicephalus sanguineus]